MKFKSSLVEDSLQNNCPPPREATRGAPIPALPRASSARSLAAARTGRRESAGLPGQRWRGSSPRFPPPSQVYVCSLEGQRRWPAGRQLSELRRRGQIYRSRCRIRCYPGQISLGAEAAPADCGFPLPAEIGPGAQIQCLQGWVQLSQSWI